MTSSFSARFFFVFLVVAFVTGVWGLVRTHQDGFTATFRQMVQGEASIAYEKAYNQKVWTYEPSLAAWSTVNYGIFNEGNKGVLIGKDNWLFTDEEFSEGSKPDEAVTEKLSYIKTVRDDLKQSGTELLLVLIPAKARIYNDLLGPYAYPSYKEGIYDSFAKQVVGSGGAICDLRKSLTEARTDGRAVFFRTDTHWTPYGADIAARTTAGCLKSALKSLEFKKTDYKETAELNDTVLKGDLTRYVPTPVFGGGAEDSYRPRAFEAAGASPVSESSLFDTDTPDITLVGTSYSANPSWQFADFLQYHIGAQILNAADQGKGPFETMKKYLEDASYKETPPKLVLWEIPERYLTMPFNPNEKAPKQ